MEKILTVVQLPPSATAATNNSIATFSFLFCHARSTALLPLEGELTTKEMEAQSEALFYTPTVLII